MTCKANFILTVREIMPRQLPLCNCCGRICADICICSAQKDLDRSSEWYIIILTDGRRHPGDLVNAQQADQKVQARCPQAAWHAQSTSERGDRSPIPNWRFLRSRRPRASQVRDASSRHSREAVGYSVHFSIRLLTPYLLPSGSRLPARWPVRALTREARAPARPQTHAGGSGFHDATPVERAFVAPFGLGRGHPGTVRYKCSSAEYRTCTETAGKKTSLNPVAGACKTTEPETLISAYEDLRRQAAKCSTSGGVGMVIFLDQGMAAWMLACSWVASTNPANLRRCPTTTAPVPDELRGEIVLVLAAMALKQAPEVYP